MRFSYQLLPEQPLDELLGGPHDELMQTLHRRGRPGADDGHDMQDLHDGSAVEATRATRCARRVVGRCRARGLIAGAPMSRPRERRLTRINRRLSVLARAGGAAMQFSGILVGSDEQGGQEAVSAHWGQA